jgi:hypothetical protein
MDGVAGENRPLERPQIANNTQPNSMGINLPAPCVDDSEWNEPVMTGSTGNQSMSESGFFAHDKSIITNAGLLAVCLVLGSHFAAPTLLRFLGISI